MNEFVTTSESRTVTAHEIFNNTGEFSGTLYRTYSEGEGVKFYYGDDLSYLEMQRK